MADVTPAHNAFPQRMPVDNIEMGNWPNGIQVCGLLTNYENDLILDDHLVEDERWLEDAVRVMKDAGIEKSAGPVEHRDAKAGASEPDH